MSNSNFSKWNDNGIMYDQYNTTVTEGITLAKAMVGIASPYTIDRRPDGEVVIFSTHFLEAFATALSKNCIANMTEKEKDLYFEYTRYVKYKSESDVLQQTDKDAVYAALDAWAMVELAGETHIGVATCS